MKTILLLGGSAQQVIAIETAKRLGLRTVLCDYLPDNPGQHHADKFYLVSTTDKEAVLGVAEQEKIDGIIAYASDPAAPTAAFVAEKLDLPTNPYNAVNILCNKDLFRDYLLSHGFSVPKASGFSSYSEAIKSLDSFNYPVIIKPVDSSGSKGVAVVRNMKGVSEALQYAFSYSRNHRIIVEEYIEKKHKYLIGGDIFISEGKVVQWGLMNCHRDNSVNPLVPVGKSYPAVIDPIDLNAVKDTLRKLVFELGIRFGPMNVELIVDSSDHVYPIDIGPRSGGNMIPDLLSMIFDCDLVEMSIRAAMGEAIDLGEMQGNQNYATLNVHSNRSGAFDRIEISPKIEQYVIKKEIYKKKGDEVRTFKNSSDALGIVFFRFPDQKTMIDIEDHMNAYVNVILQRD